MDNTRPIDKILPRLPRVQERYGSWTASCPVPSHGRGGGDRSRSLSVSEADDGRVLIHCFAGCSVDDVCAAVGLHLGDLFPRGGSGAGAPPPELLRQARAREAEQRESANRQAIQIFASAHPIRAGDPADMYLRRVRQLEPALSDHWPSDLRFAPKLWHSDSKRAHPGLVAIVRDTIGRPQGIQRLFLRPDGRKADVVPQRKMLGACSGHGVYLGLQPHEFGERGDTVVVAEGIESTLAVMREAHFPGIAALSADGMTALLLPPGIRRVYAVPDIDPPRKGGRAHAPGVGMRAAFNLCERLERDGVEASALDFLPPEGRSDWADHG